MKPAPLGAAGHATHAAQPPSSPGSSDEQGPPGNQLMAPLNQTKSPGGHVAVPRLLSCSAHLQGTVAAVQVVQARGEDELVKGTTESLQAEGEEQDTSFGSPEVRWMCPKPGPSRATSSQRARLPAEPVQARCGRAGEAPAPTHRWLRIRQAQLQLHDLLRFHPQLGAEQGKQHGAVPLCLGRKQGCGQATGKPPRHATAPGSTGKPPVTALRGLPPFLCDGWEQSTAEQVCSVRGEARGYQQGTGRGGT